MIKIFLTYIILFSSQSFAQGYKIKQSECSNIDIRDGKPEAIRTHFSEPLDQGSIGWCYGYAAAELMAVEAGEPLSGTHISSIYNKYITKNPITRGIWSLLPMNKGRDTFQSGFINGAMRQAQYSNPICAYNQTDADTRIIHLLEAIRKDYKNGQSRSEEACAVVEKVMPALKLTEREFFEKFVNENMNLSLEQYLRDSCRQVNVPSKEIMTLHRPIIGGKNYYASAVNEVLELGKPLGIQYNIKHIIKPKFADVEEVGDPALTGRGDHASVVIGRRWVNNRCEYNIRNSWGRSCPYNEEIECNSDDGSYWIKDETFFSMAYNFTYLQ